MAIDNLHNLPSNKKDYEYINVPENPIYYLSAAEYNHLVETLKEFIDDYNIKMSGNAPSQDISIITTGDAISTPTDENVFSSLRTLAEIYNSLEGVNTLYLSKKKDDTAEGNIKFDKNVFFGDFLSGGTGITGKGGKVDRGGNAELHSLKLREWLEVPEIRYNRTEIISGDRWRAPGGGIVESVDLENKIIKLKLEEGEYGELEEDDLCMGIFHSMVSSRNATETTDDGRNNRTIKGFATSYFKIIEALNPSENNSEFRYELRPGHTIPPEKFMHFAAFGNTTKKHRQSSVFETRSYQRFLIGMNTWENDMKNIAAQFGDMTNLNTFETGDLYQGYSAYLNNIYLSGSIMTIKPPMIQDGYWFVWDNDLKEYVPTGVKAEGKDGEIINAVQYSIVPSTALIERNDSGVPDINNVSCILNKTVLTIPETMEIIPVGYEINYQINGNGVILPYNYGSNIAITRHIKRIDFTLSKGRTVLSRATTLVLDAGRLNFRMNPSTVSVVSESDTKKVLGGLPVDINCELYYGSKEKIAITELEVNTLPWIDYTINEDNSIITVNKPEFLLQEVSRLIVTATALHKGATVTVSGTVEIVKAGSSGKDAVMLQLRPSATAIKRDSKGAPDHNPLSCKVLEVVGSSMRVLSDLPEGCVLKYKIGDGAETVYNYSGAGISILPGVDKISFTLYKNGILIDNADVIIYKDGDNNIYLDSSNGILPIKVDSNNNVVSGLPARIPFKILYGLEELPLKSLAINPAISGITSSANLSGKFLTVSKISNLVSPGKDFFTFNLVGKATLNGVEIERVKEITVTKTIDGAVGKDAVVHSLLSSVQALLLDAEGEFVGENKVKCSILKTTGEVTVSLDSIPTDYTLTYRKNDVGSFLPYTYNTNIQAVKEDYKITFNLKYKTLLIDSIEIPILKEGTEGGVGKPGADGESPIILHLDNSFLSIKVSDTNKHLSGLPVDIKARMFHGINEVPLNTLVVTTANVTNTVVPSTGMIRISNVDMIEQEVVEIGVKGTVIIEGKTYTREAVITLVKIRDGEQGPAGISVPVVFRGEWNQSSKYFGSENRRDIVKITNLETGTSIYYMTVSRAGEITGIGTKPPNLNYWTVFEGNYQSVATDLLLAEKANIGGFAFSGYTKADGVPMQSIISQVGIDWKTKDSIDLRDYDSIIEKFLPNLTLNGEHGYVQLRNSILLNSDGTGYLANNNLKWDGLGNLFVGPIASGYYDINNFQNDVPLYTEFSKEGYSYWHFPYNKGDGYVRFKIGDGHWSHAQKIGPASALDKTVTHYHYQWVDNSQGIPHEGWEDTINMALGSYTFMRRRLWDVETQEYLDWGGIHEITPPGGNKTYYTHPTHFKSDGSGWMANGNLSWDTKGDLTINNLKATGVDLEGKITATSGTIGGFDVSGGWLKAVPNPYGGTSQGFISIKSGDEMLIRLGTDLIPSSAGGLFTLLGQIENKLPTSGIWAQSEENIALKLVAENKQNNTALDAKGDIITIGTIIELGNAHADSGFVDSISLNIGRHHTYVFSPTEYVVVELPTGAEINAKIRNSATNYSQCFEITVLVHKSSAGSIALRGKPMANIIDNDGNVTNSKDHSQGQIKMAKGDVAKLMFYNHSWYVISLSN